MNKFTNTNTAEKWLIYAAGEDLYPTTKEQAVTDLRGASLAF